MLFAHGLPPLFSPIPALRNFSIMDRAPSFLFIVWVSYWLSSLFIWVLCNHLVIIRALCNPLHVIWVLCNHLVIIRALCNPLHVIWVLCNSIRILGTMQLSFHYIIWVLCNLLLIIQIRKTLPLLLGEPGAITDSTPLPSRIYPSIYFYNSVQVVTFPVYSYFQL